MTNKQWDKRFMAAAGRFSRRHLGVTAENPSVGALIIQFDGDKPVIVGRGVTAEGGRPHAEIQALKEAGQLAKGATAYVTLEPCSHYGKTPPCAEALIKAGVSRVVIAVKDPDERVRGNGIFMLQSAGIAVDMIYPEKSVKSGLNGYLKRKIDNRPEVTLKLAISADNALGRLNQGFIPISSPLSRERAHILRMEHDAILVGIGTILADDPLLNCRLPGLEKRSPIRIVVDSLLKTPLTSKVVQTAQQYPLWIVCHEDAESGRKKLLEKQGCQLLVSSGQNGKIDLAALLECLANKNVSSLLVEGGQQIAQSFYDLGLCDSLILFHSHRMIGKDGVSVPPFHDLKEVYSIDETYSYEGDQCNVWRRNEDVYRDNNRNWHNNRH